MLVPESSSQPPGTDERMLEPGALRSGLRRSDTGVGPSDEKPDTTFGAPPRVVVTEPTVIARVELAGEPTDPCPSSS
jgi:hypothetical protein